MGLENEGSVPLSLGFGLYQGRKLDASSQLAYRRMLVEHHDVDVALGGQEALRLLESGQDYDVILCDLQMPEMSGAELYRTVKERWPARAERFIIITGGAFSAEAKKFIDEVPVTRINKPFQLEELLELVDRRVAAATSQR